jgi:uncharacterized protein YbjT (DUF2867 family)
MGVEIAPGNFDDRPSLDRALAGASAAFSVQNFQEGGVEAEARQGIALAEAAKAASIEHLVYTSVDGAERRSGVPHFESKWRIEQRIGELGLKATILRPVAFMDMLGGPRPARALFLGVFRAALGPSKRLQLVASTDIGWFAARALEQPAEYAGKALALAGNELSVAEMREVFQRVVPAFHRPRGRPAARLLGRSPRPRTQGPRH